MEFIIKDIDGNEHGPVDQDTLKKWVDEDRANGDTPVRNSLIGNWKTISELDFMQENLALQTKRLEESVNSVGQSINSINSIRSIFKKDKKVKTSFAHQHEQEAACVSSRIWSFVFDLGLMTLVIFLPLFAAASYYAYSYAEANTDKTVAALSPQDVLAQPEKDEPAEAVQAAPPVSPPPAETKNIADASKETAATAEKEPAVPDVKPVTVKKKPILDNMKANTPPCTKACESAGYVQGAMWADIKDGKNYICLSGAENEARWINTVKLKRIYTFTAVIALLLTMIYYGVTLGYFAQTFGMWFWGIFITKNDIGEVYFFRAFAFTVLMLMLGILAPLFVYIFGRAPHDMLAGVRVINVFGKTQI